MDTDGTWAWGCRAWTGTGRNMGVGGSGTGRQLRQVDRRAVQQRAESSDIATAKALRQRRRQKAKKELLRGRTTRHTAQLWGSCGMHSDAPVAG